MFLKYAVIGTGAIGGFYGGKLARSGKDVHFLFRSDYSFVKTYGLRVDSVTGNFYISNINAYKEASSMPQCDVVLICLKTTNNAMLKNILPHIIHKNSIAILIQNGLGVEDDVAATFPELSLAGGLAFICSSKAGPGHIRHLDYGKLNLGIYGNTPNYFLQQVKTDLNDAGIETEIFNDLLLARWQKLVWNIPFNGLTVALNTTTDRIMKNESSSQLAYDMMIEVIEGANKCGIALEKNYADKMISLTREMTSYETSMKIDFNNKRPMEIDYIYSQPLKMALEAGYIMNKVSMLEQQLRFIQGQYMTNY